MKTHNINVKLDSILSLYELSEIASKAKLRLSNCGRVKIIVDEFQGSLGLDALTIKILEIAKIMNYEFNNEDRKNGKKIRKKIDSIYWKYDELYNASSLLKRIFIIFTTKILELINSDFSKSVRVKWEEDSYYRMFNLYTYNQFNKEFNKYPLERDASVYSGAPNRWMSIKKQSKIFLFLQNKKIDLIETIRNKVFKNNFEGFEYSSGIDFSKMN